MSIPCSTTNLIKKRQKNKRMPHIEVTKLMEKDEAVLMFYITTKLLPEFNLIIALFIRHELSQ